MPEVKHKILVISNIQRHVKYFTGKKSLWMIERGYFAFERCSLAGSRWIQFQCLTQSLARSGPSVNTCQIDLS